MNTTLKINLPKLLTELGLSNNHLAEITGAHVNTVSLWKKRGTISKSYAANLKRWLKDNDKDDNYVN